MSKFEYATMEWLWDVGTMRVDTPAGLQEAKGTYPEVVKQLTELGAQGWEVCACVATANWLFWTLKRSQ